MIYAPVVQEKNIKNVVGQKSKQVKILLRED